MFSADYPFENPAEAGAFMQELPLDAGLLNGHRLQQCKPSVSHRNANMNVAIKHASKNTGC